MDGELLREFSIRGVVEFILWMSGGGGVDRGMPVALRIGAWSKVYFTTIVVFWAMKEPQGSQGRPTT